MARVEFARYEEGPKFLYAIKNDITREWLNTRSREQRTNCVGDANATVALNEALETKSLEKTLKSKKPNHLKENHWNG